jgi:hypothetical protein
MTFKACFALSIPNDCKFRLENLQSFILVKSTCNILSSNCPKTQKTSVLHNQMSYRRFKGSSELVGIRATDFVLSFSPSNVVFGDQIAFEDRSFWRSYRSIWPLNSAREAKSLEVNVVEHANRSQHAKLFWVHVLTFWVIIISDSIWEKLSRRVRNQKNKVTLFHHFFIIYKFW